MCCAMSTLLQILCMEMEVPENIDTHTRVKYELSKKLKNLRPTDKYNFQISLLVSY